jgi:serine/threonine protein kinase
MLVARLARAALGALAVIHEAGDADGPLGLVHADVSPSNLLGSALPPADGGPAAAEAVLVDFGLSRRRGSPAWAPGPFRGTPRYVAPEVARGEEPTVRSDLFSLGLTLTHVASGLTPRDAPWLHAVLLLAGDEPVTGFVERATESLPSSLRETLLAMVAFDPAERPVSAREAAAMGSW